MLTTGAAGVTFHRRRMNRAIELERIRTAIASDLHDDIGANLSQISLLTEMVRARAIDADPRAARSLSSIADLSRESVDAMSDIVWAINPQKDRLTSVTSRMRRFANELLGARDIEFVLHLAEGVEDMQLPADVRRQVYLVFKETLHNVVRHANARRVQIDLRVDGDLTLTVADDGKGFDPQAASEGHGLRSLRERAERAGGTFSVRSHPAGGDNGPAARAGAHPPDHMIGPRHNLS